MIGSRSGRRLVVEHALRVRDHGAREAGALDHAARKLGRKAFARRSASPTLSSVSSTRARISSSGMLRAFAQRQRDVVEDREANRTARQTETKSRSFARDPISSRSCSVVISWP